MMSEKTQATGYACPYRSEERVTVTTTVDELETTPGRFRRALNHPLCTGAVLASLALAALRLARRH